MSAITIAAKGNGNSRPMSASTRHKRVTGRGLGYFCDDNDKIKETQ
jgi:hypothetical protein